MLVKGLLGITATGLGLEHDPRMLLGTVRIQPYTTSVVYAYMYVIEDTRFENPVHAPNF